MRNNINEMLDKLENVSGSEGHWTALCPAHDNHKNSLSIGIGSDGKILLHCFAGCDYNTIIDKLGVKEIKGGKTSKSTGKKIIKSYDYVDEKSSLLYQVVRTEPKGFFQRRPTMEGGWVNGLKGIRKVLYNLPGVLDAMENGEQIFFVEGEKDADRLISCGLTATTTAGGASSWKSEYAKYLGGSKLVIIPDNDNADMNYARKIADEMVGSAKSVKIIKLSNLAEKGDISDWLDIGNTVQDLKRIISITEAFKSDKKRKLS